MYNNNVMFSLVQICMKNNKPIGTSYIIHVMYIHIIGTGTGDRRQETEDKRQKTEDRRQETGGRIPSSIMDHGTMNSCVVVVRLAALRSYDATRFGAGARVFEPCKGCVMACYVTR